MMDVETAASLDHYVTQTVDRPFIAEETANQLTHGLGFVASLLGAVFLIENIQTGAATNQIIGCGVYLASLVSLYAASTLSHSFRHDGWRNFFRMLDQICIFALIVGTFTPFALVHLHDGYWMAFLAVLWLIAVVGSVTRIFSNNRSLSTLYFVPLAWLPVITLGRMAAIGGATGLSLIVAGGMAYMAGIWFLVNDNRARYYHAVWHLFVIAGSTFHYIFVLRYVAMWTA